ncbi:hypothetical protein C5Y82_11135 [Bacillus pumilus]|nr:hypothetical protein C5Y82_11135 [Bacillus pumilus]
MSGLRFGAHECSIRSAPMLVLPRLQRFSITLKRRQSAKIKIILALCPQSITPLSNDKGVTFIQQLGSLGRLPQLLILIFGT